MTRQQSRTVFKGRPKEVACVAKLKPWDCLTSAGAAGASGVEIYCFSHPLEVVEAHVIRVHI